MLRKLHTSLNFNILVVLKLLNTNHRIYNSYTKFAKILEICKQFPYHIVNHPVNDKGNTCQNHRQISALSVLQL